MLLIADSGSTKTDWLLLDKGKEVYSVKTRGLNPFFVTTDHTVSVMTEAFAGKIDAHSVNKVYFYGSGCSDFQQQKVIENALNQYFQHSDNFVEHDLLGAARALFGNESGIAGILGTGSNTCLYDGNTVTDHLFSLGYVYGCEGSGTYLGQNYLRLHLKNLVPEDLRIAFEKMYSLTPQDILTQTYSSAHPNIFLASFTVFLSQHKDHPFIAELLENLFADFFREQVFIYPGYKNLTFSCIGSVGFFFRDVIKRVAGKNGISAEKFLVSPLEGLRNFHQA